MASRNIPLPIAPLQYVEQLEAEFRRQLELQLLRMGDSIESNSIQANKQASLALRRHQFLLMGAS